MEEIVDDTDTFEIGLVMAGAISAGAYTAGVIDFLYETLDAWQKAKDDPQTRDNTPAHNVTIRVVTGASAGGMTAALIASTMQRAVTPVRTPRQSPGENNPLYDAWVARVDIKDLLTTDDLDHNPVQSVLNAHMLEGLAANVFEGGTRLDTPRPYVADPLKLIMTITNVAGVPYAVKMANHDASHGMRLHKDFLQFTVGTTTADTQGIVPAADLKHEGWAAVRNAALASGAFPIGLAAKPITRVGGDYAERLFRLPVTDGQRVYVKPDWELLADSPYFIGGIDGGMMDNEPLELARQALLKENETANPRPASIAHRAVIMIDPFPESNYLTIADAAKKPDIGLTDILGALLPAFKNQARFKLEELQLAVDENVFSRFMIAPVRWGDYRDPKDKTKILTGITPTIACGALGGFGGFLDRDFREHDYQLGRRNCESFLRNSFVLPTDNVVMKKWGPAKTDDYVVTAYKDASGKFISEQERKTELDANRQVTPVNCLPIIPVLPGVRIDQSKPLEWPGLTKDEVKTLLHDRINTRLREVGTRMVNDTKLNVIKKTLIKSLLLLLDGNLVDAGLDYVVSSLDDNLQLKPPHTLASGPTVSFGPHGQGIPR